MTRRREALSAPSTCLEHPPRSTHIDSCSRPAAREAAAAWPSPSLACPPPDSSLSCASARPSVVVVIAHAVCPPSASPLHLHHDNHDSTSPASTRPGPLCPGVPSRLSLSRLAPHADNCCSTNHPQHGLRRPARDDNARRAVARLAEKTPPAKPHPPPEPAHRAGRAGRAERAERAERADPTDPTDTTARCPARGKRWPGRQSGTRRTPQAARWSGTCADSREQCA